MKILFLSQRFLFPMDTGGKIRTGNILKQLSKRADITVISNVDRRKDEKYLHNMDELCSKFIAVPWVESERHTFGFYCKLAFKSLSRYPISVLNDYSRELAKALREELAADDYDLVICDFLQSTLNFKGINGVPMLLFQHNVEAQITQRHVLETKNPLAKLFWSLQHWKMHRHEKAMCCHFGTTIAVSDSDKAIMENWYGADNVETIPTGVDTELFSPDESVEERRQLVFTGSMDWLPNEDAMKFFLESIFPKVKAKLPDTSLVIVGRRPSAAIKRLINDREDIELTGWVEDTRPYIASSAVYIVPIRIGGGTRMKIYEAMAMGKALVSTTVGAEGLPLTHGEHFYRSDDVDDFAAHIVSLLENPEQRAKLGKNARSYVFENFRWEKVADCFLSICEQAALDCKGNNSAHPETTQTLGG